MSLSCIIEKIMKCFNKTPVRRIRKNQSIYPGIENKLITRISLLQNIKRYLKNNFCTIFFSNFFFSSSTKMFLSLIIALSTACTIILLIKKMELTLYAKFRSSDHKVLKKKQIINFYKTNLQQKSF